MDGFTIGLSVMAFFAFISVWFYFGSFWAGIITGSALFGLIFGVSKLIGDMPALETFQFATFLAFGTIGFWLLLAATAIAVLSLIEYEFTITAALSVLASLLLLQFFGDVRIFSHLFTNPWLIPVYIAVYAACGILWSVVKWYLLVTENDEENLERTAQFLRQKGISEIVVPDHLKYEWYFFIRDQRYSTSYEDLKRSFLKSKGIYDKDLVPENIKDALQQFLKETYEAIPNPSLAPQWRKYKNKIASWIVHWPWSLIWTLLDDPIKRFLRFVFRHLPKIYDAVSQYASKRTNQNLPQRNPGNHQ